MLRISRSLMASVRGEAASSREEVCGLLLGQPVRPDLLRGPASSLVSQGSCTTDKVRGDEIVVVGVLPSANVHATPATHFEIDPVVLLAAHRAARAGGPSIVGHYHSHPSGQAEPSSTDAAMATPDGAIWLVVAGDDVTAWQAKLDGRWRGRFDPVTIVDPAGCADEAAPP